MTRGASSRLIPLLLVVSALGAGRFAYALTASAAGWTGMTYMEVVYERQAAGLTPASTSAQEERRWGPLFFLMMAAAHRVAPSPRGLSLLIRVSLTALYGLTIFLLTRLLVEFRLPWLQEEGRCRRFIVVFLCLQSTAAIYAISNGSETVSVFCVVAHFYYFVRKQFLAAALLIGFGVYFKLFSVVFLFPYFLFSLLSRDDRRYAAWLVGSAVLFALVSLPVAGWTFGAFYPIAMFRSVMSESSMIPLRSAEVFGPLFFVTRLFTSFSVHRVDPDAAALGRLLSSACAVLLVTSTAVCAVVLRASQHRWNRSVGQRQLALFLFQSAIGFAMVSFSPDMSITLLLPVIVSLYAPLWVFAQPVCGPTPDARTVVTFGLFALGTILVGNLVPLSVLLRILPFAWLDRLAGNASTDLILHEKFMWYQIPLIGVYCIAASSGCALLTLGRARGCPARFAHRAYKAALNRILNVPNG